MSFLTLAPLATLTPTVMPSPTVTPTPTVMPSPAVTPTPTVTLTPTITPVPLATPPRLATHTPFPPSSEIPLFVPRPTFIPTDVLTRVLRDVPKFLALPFAPDPHMALLQGWYYDSGQLHSGIDYFRFQDHRGQGRGGGFTRFPVLAAASGYACGQRDDALRFEDEPVGTCVQGYGNRVFIRHQIRGETYYTYYGHLETIADDIPLDDRSHTVFVEQGEFLGYAGNTGTGGGTIHLHFGLFSPHEGWIDPYDLYQTHEHYPDPSRGNGILSGFNDYWETNPPSYPTATHWSPEGAIDTPLPNAQVGGVVPVRGWAKVRESTIDRIEIWLNGKLHQIAAYGLQHQVAGGPYGFRWNWDTTRGADGPQTIQVRAVAANGRSALLPIPEDTGTQPQEAMDHNPAHQPMHPSGARETEPRKTNDKMLVVEVHNPRGYIDTPLPGASLRGVQQITGWVKIAASQIHDIEIWIDWEFRGFASQQEDQETSGVRTYHFRWGWDTKEDTNGWHTIHVRAVAKHGGQSLLRHGGACRDAMDSALLVRVDNPQSNPHLDHTDKWIAQ